ncbi:hypothetical protein QUB10_24835 [Microcoleus sp. B5-D4]|uniref:hypothetical protein n=1 Tax=unclassified Microcoleus TaxID=2642155 RepID=UPI002FD531D5
MPVPQNQGGTGILPVAAIWNRQDACSTIENFLVEQASCLLRPLGTGKMPVPQSSNFLWNRHLACCGNYEQARCLFHNQAISCATGILPVAANLEQARCLFHNQAISCATGILPVANNLEQARCLFHNQAISCATGILPVANTSTTSTPMNKAH